MGSENLTVKVNLRMALNRLNKLYHGQLLVLIFNMLLEVMGFYTHFAILADTKKNIVDT